MQEGATGSRSYDELELVSYPTRQYVKHEIHGDNAWLVRGASTMQVADANVTFHHLSPHENFQSSKMNSIQYSC